MSGTTNQRQLVYLLLLGLIALAGVGILIFDEVAGRPVDQTLTTILAFITGVLSHQLGGSQGATQTLNGVTTGTKSNGILKDGTP